MSTRVIVTPDENGNNPSVQIAGSSIMQPVDIQNHLQTTIQTHNAVSVAAGATSSGAWIDSNGYDKVAVNVKSDASTTYNVNVDWSTDGGTTQTGSTTVVASSASFTKTGIVDTQARYLRVTIVSGDVAAHTMSAWAYLKA